MKKPWQVLPLIEIQLRFERAMPSSFKRTVTGGLVAESPRVNTTEHIGYLKQQIAKVSASPGDSGLITYQLFATRVKVRLPVRFRH